MPNQKEIIKKIFIFVLPVLFYLMCGLTFAADVNDGVFGTYTGVVSSGSCTMAGKTTIKAIIVDFIVGCFFYNFANLILAGSLITFLWGTFKFIKSEGDDKQEGRDFMFWGVIGIAVMVSFWGIISILQNIFGF